MTGTRRARRRQALTMTALATGIPALAALPAGPAAADQGPLQVTVTVPGVGTTTTELPAPIPALPVGSVSTPVASVGPAATPTNGTGSGTGSGSGDGSGGGTAPTGAPATGPAGPRSPSSARPGVRPGATVAPRAGAPAHRRHHGPHRAARPGFAPDGVPTPRNPSFSIAVPGPAPLGVPNFFIDKFRIPPFLLPIYQAAGVQYGVRWELLAAINEIETDYGRNVSTSSAGAVGWMQFMPATWKRWGVDANGDGRKDPYNPVDAIFGAARYLQAAGVATDVRKAIFAYNHADWYVDSVLMRARLIGGTPAEVIGSLTGLTQGRFPVAATARYADGRRATDIFARDGAAVVAVQDATITQLGRSRALGRFVRVRDAYGNTYTYARLAHLARTYVVAPRRRGQRAPRAVAAVLPVTGPALPAADPAMPAKERLFAHPGRHAAPAVRTDASGGEVRALRVGARVPGGTVLGRIGTGSDPAHPAPHVRFSIRPASDPAHPAPAIDPKPLLDGWKLLESTAIYRARGRNPLTGPNPSIGQVLLMSKAQLVRRVLADPRITIYPGGRGDVRSGQIDRRVLATLAFLSASGLKPTVSCLKTGHGYLTSSGNVSEHSSGNAADISAINGVPILGHQGPGSITDITIRRLLTLQGVMKPHQIISLMTFAGTDNTLALPDHADHIHVGFRPGPETVLRPIQWTRLIARLGRIDNPSITDAER